MAPRGQRESPAQQVHRDLRGREATSQSARTQLKDPTVPCACGGHREPTESLVKLESTADLVLKDLQASQECQETLE